MALCCTSKNLGRGFRGKAGHCSQSFGVDSSTFSHSSSASVKPRATPELNLEKRRCLLQHFLLLERKARNRPYVVNRFHFRAGKRLIGCSVTTQESVSSGKSIDQSRSEDASEQGFRSLVNDLSKPAAESEDPTDLSQRRGTYRNESSVGDRDAAPSSRTFIRTWRKADNPASNGRQVDASIGSEDATTSSRTFIKRWVRSDSDKPSGNLDGSDEARRQSSFGASSSSPSNPDWEARRREGGVRQFRSSKYVVDRWVSDSDSEEEDYLSRRPSYYGKRDRTIAREFSGGYRGSRGSVGPRPGGYGQKERRDTGGGQVATLQRPVQRSAPVELLSEARKRRALEAEQKALEKAQRKLEKEQKKLAKEQEALGDADTLLEEQQQTTSNISDSAAEVLDSASEVLDSAAEESTAESEGERGVGEEVVEEAMVDHSEGLSKEETEGGGEKEKQEKRLGRKQRKQREKRPQLKLMRRVTELAQRRQLDKVFEELARAREKGLKPDLKCLNAVISACARCANFDKARDVFCEMVAEGGTGVNEITYGALLKALGAAGRVEEALRLLDLMDTPTAPGPPQVTDVHVCIVLNACAEAGDAVRARRLLEDRMTRSTLAYNMLIKAHAKSATPLGALLVVDEMRAHGLALDRNTYNSLILACVNGDHMPRAWELLNEMKSRSKFLEGLQLAPDVVTYTTLLRGVARPGALASVLRLAEEMHAAPSCTFDRVAYGALIDACVACGSPDTAESVLAEMEERGEEDPKLRPGPHAFLALMRAFAAVGDMERCEEMREGMFSSRCGGWASVGERQEADELCMEAAIASGYTGPAKRLLRTMKAVKEGRPLSQRATTALVRLYASEGFLLHDSLRLQPLKFRADAFPAARVVTRSLPVIPELMFVTGEQNAEEVAGRLEEAPVVLVVRQSEAGEMEFLGYLTEADLRGDGLPLTDLMRPLPPPISFDDPISHAATLLLQHSSEVLLVVEQDQAQPQGDKALATVVGIVTRGQLFEGGSESAFAPGCQSDDESGLEMIKQDLSKKGAVPGVNGATEPPVEKQVRPSTGVRTLPWRSRLAQLFDMGSTGEEVAEVAEIAEIAEVASDDIVEELPVEDDMGLEMIRQDMMKLDGAPSSKKSAISSKTQKGRKALAYLEGLDLET